MASGSQLLQVNLTSKPHGLSAERMRDTVLDHGGLDLAFKATSITAASVAKLSQTHFATSDRLFSAYICHADTDIDRAMQV
jgi:hypothetical protein